MIKNFQSEKIKPLINEEFDIQGADGGDSFKAKLSSIEHSSDDKSEWDSFRVLFDVDETCQEIISEKTYVLKHKDIGEVSLFGSPNSEKELEFCCSYHKDDK